MIIKSDELFTDFYEKTVDAGGTLYKKYEDSMAECCFCGLRLSIAYNYIIDTLKACGLLPKGFLKKCCYCEIIVNHSDSCSVVENVPSIVKIKFWNVPWYSTKIRRYKMNKIYALKDCEDKRKFLRNLGLPYNKV